MRCLYTGQEENKYPQCMTVLGIFWPLLSGVSLTILGQCLFTQKVFSSIGQWTVPQVQSSLDLSHSQSPSLSEQRLPLWYSIPQLDLSKLWFSLFYSVSLKTCLSSPYLNCGLKTTCRQKLGVIIGLPWLFLFSL